MCKHKVNLYHILQLYYTIMKNVHTQGKLAPMYYNLCTLLHYNNYHGDYLGPTICARQNHILDSQSACISRCFRNPPGLADFVSVDLCF